MKKKEVWLDCIFIIVLGFVAYFVNHFYEIHALCLDDFGFSRCFERNLVDIILPSTGDTKFRPVSSFIIWLCCCLVKTKIYLFTYILWIMSFLSAVIIFLIGKEWSNSRISGAFTAVCFLVSRFSYYDITQVLGIMEGIALIFSILMVYFLHRFLEIPSKRKYFYMALAFYILAVLTHERYIALFPIFIISIFLNFFLKKNNDWVKLSLMSFALFIAVLLLRFVALGMNSMSGTGGTNIVDTFSFGTFFRFFLAVFKYMAGINAFHEDHLNGRFWGDLSADIQHKVYINIAILIAAFILTVFFFIKNGVKKNKKFLANIILLSCFILGCAVSASVTFRLELRWIYTPYVGLMLLLPYIICNLAFPLSKDDNSNWKRVLRITRMKRVLGTGVMILFAYLTFSVDGYYKNWWPELYYWNTQLFANRLYDETVKKYGDEIWEYKAIVIIGELPRLQENFLDPYRPVEIPNSSVPALYYFDVIEEIPQTMNSQQIVILNADDMK